MGRTEEGTCLSSSSRGPAAAEEMSHAEQREKCIKTGDTRRMQGWKTAAMARAKSEWAHRARDRFPHCITWMGDVQIDGEHSSCTRRV